MSIFPIIDVGPGGPAHHNRRETMTTADSEPIRVLPEMVECDCGHECGAAMVMSASMGTACPDCYDMMSD